MRHLTQDSHCTTGSFCLDVAIYPETLVGKPNLQAVTFASGLGSRETLVAYLRSLENNQAEKHDGRPLTLRSFRSSIANLQE